MYYLPSKQVVFRCTICHLNKSSSDVPTICHLHKSSSDVPSVIYASPASVIECEPYNISSIRVSNTATLASTGTFINPFIIGTKISTLTKLFSVHIVLLVLVIK
jgi:hypothetical protein